MQKSPRQSRSKHQAQSRPAIARRHAKGRRGFSIMEIVVAMIIIAILVLILTPTLSNRAAQARLRSAQQEMEHIADAEERAALDTNYFWRLYVLNDVIGGDGFRNDGQLNIGINGTQDIELSTVHTTPKKIFIDIQTEDFSPDFTALYDRFHANETAFNWNGPYVNWKRDVNLNDWPDDPWGHDYLLATKVGILFPKDPTATSATGVVIRDDAFATTGPAGQNVRNLFDRPAIISLGPDGLPGNGLLNPTGDGIYGTGDDLVRKFK